MLIDIARLTLKSDTSSVSTSTVRAKNGVDNQKVKKVVLTRNLKGHVIFESSMSLHSLSRLVLTQP